MGVRVLHYRVLRARLWAPRASALSRALAGLADPSEVGITPAKAIRLASASGFTVTGASLLAAMLVYTGYLEAPLWPLILLAALGAMLSASKWVWRAVSGPMIDREVPALLSYLLPYSPVASHVADLIAELSDSKGFKWVRFEAERLKVFMRLGMDPERALQRLVDTTSSRMLASTLSDYIYAQRLGAPKSQLTMILLRNTLETVRSQWDSYSQLVRGIGEIGVTLVVALAVAAPLAALMAGDTALLIAAAPILLAPLAALLLIALRPPLGDVSPGALTFAASYSLPFALALASLALGPREALILGAAAAAAVELVSAYWGRRADTALKELKRAADKARYGLDYKDSMERAEILARGVIRAVMKASMKAGRSGVGEALENMYRVFSEARSKASSIKGQAIVLALVSMLAPAIAIYSLRIMFESSPPGLLGFSDELAGTLVKLMIAGAPLITLPAASLHRPWNPSLIPGLAAMALAYLASTAPIGL